ncbi:hypothetical protein [Cellvibrio sp. PSBB006]|uniref:hypothetical protein n=1 Tax=Cellvibrio sp. PSBB006 TaxID=1987723 RepID=UPI000B3B2049|nr:hypothetical protein [Cellvibrio sp. PSBB006]ARU26067.1 hypothetical protein CBR65_00695 [Cellvibrio sp. PSBB006]
MVITPLELDTQGFLGAIASNAGDDFHTLWAAREILRLLDANGDVTAIKVEGLPLDEIHAHVGEHGQAVDIHLARNTKNGATNTYLQLKYSASTPKEGWSWSRLLTRRAKTKPLSSVLGKLAGLMKAVGFKGDFAIVTNQPLSTTVADDVARLISNGSKPIPEDAELFNTLTKALRLTPKQLITFLKTWDTTGFSSVSRLILESEVIQRLAGMSDADARDDANLLQRKVSTLMLPENRNHPAITRETLLIWLGVGSTNILFPAPPHIKPAQPYLRRTLIDRLSEKLNSFQSKPLRIHAGGGCGKTSLISDLTSVLPSGSELFIYDCYGGGLFLASDQKRHLSEQAFTQLGNEFAVRLKTPFVIRRQGSIDIFEAFRNRVLIAADLVKFRNPDAKLVLCFDAVDNAKTGARHWQEHCFLDVLTQASSWPTNVRIVVSCRTSRREEVGEKNLYDDFEIPSFDVDEVRKLVALWHPEWNPELAATFENLTWGNPRRIVYAIEGLPNDGAARAIERLIPRAEGINPLFEQRVAEAGKHLGSTEKVWQVLDALSRLPRPVPAQTLATLTSLAPADIHDIAADVGGIIEREEGWSFHDEDFEAFVIERPDNNGNIVLDRGADLLLEIRRSDRYAATNVAEVLVASNRLNELYDLVTKEEKPSEVLTSLEAQFVWSRNLALAIRCCRTASDITNACSLLITSADAIRRAKLLEDLIVKNLDLSVQFAADEANRLVMVGQDHKAKRPSLRIELASQAAQNLPETAKMHLQWWHGYLDDLRHNQSRNDFKVSATDIASEYATYTTLFGEKAALHHLFAWRPKPALLSVFSILAAQAAGRNIQTLLNVIDSRKWSPFALAPFMAAALLAGAKMSDPVMVNALSRLAKATRARWNKPIEMGISNSTILDWHEAVLLICERSVIYDEFKPLISNILERAFPKPEFIEAHHLYRLRSAGARQARAYALRELISGIVIPVEKWLPPKREEPRNEERLARRQEKSTEARWNESLADAINAFSRFVEAGRVNLAAVTNKSVVSWPKLANVLDISRSFNRSVERDSDQAFFLIRQHLVHVGIDGGDVTTLIPLMRKVLQNWRADDTKTAHHLARTLTLLPSARDAVLTLLTELVSKIENASLAASDRVELLTENTRIALPLDPALAEWFFNKAVEATGSVDYEARNALAAAGAIARTGLTGSHAERTVYAARLGDAAGAVVESLGLAGDFDWGEVVGWITAASLPMGLVAAARWHDRGIVPFDYSLPNVTATDTTMSLAQRVALRLLASDGSVDAAAIVDDRTLLPNWVVEPLLKAKLCEGDIEAFISEFDVLENNSAHDAKPAIEAARLHRDTFQQWLDAVGAQQGSTDVTQDAPDENLTATLRTSDEIRLALETGSGEYGPNAYQFCQVAKKLASISLRVAFLNIAVELDKKRGEFGEAMLEILSHWTSYPPVTEWMRTQFPFYIAGSLPHLFRWNYSETDTLDEVLKLTGLSAAEQANVLLSGIEQHRSRISADLLYTLTGMIAARTPDEDRAGLFDALLLRVESRTSHSPRVHLIGITPPQDIIDSVARCLFGAMGDMDRRVRWRASHSALILMRGNDPAWDRLVACLAKTEEPVFAGAPFYHYAAREQLLIVLLRAAAESALDVARYAPLVLETIRTDSHVIIRELGRSVLMALEEAKVWLPSEEDYIFVEQLNRSQLDPIEPENSNWLSKRQDRSEQRKYHFDSTDAIPYWYYPISRLFGMGMDDFLDRLETWVHDKWGYGETATHWDQEPRLDRLNGQHEYTSRRHGSLSTIERLSHYVEWQAMMCAVGELIAEVPLTTSVDEVNAALDEWIDRNLPTISPHWLSDLRTAPPLESRFWGIDPIDLSEQYDKVEDREVQTLAWSKTLVPADFDLEINGVNELVVAADFEVRWNHAIHSVQVHSALVSPSTAKALAQALANTRDRWDFALPNGSYGHDIDIPGFQLEPWLHEIARETKADDFDVRRGAVFGIPVKPIEVTENEERVFNVTCSSWKSTSDEYKINFSQWGSDNSTNGYGWRATSDQAFIANLLRKKNRSLILLVEISRKLKDEDVYNNRPKWLLYVFDANGVLTRYERERRSLGRVLVRREGIEDSVDTLGRWMLHRIAELDQQRKTADQQSSEILSNEIEKLCIAFQQHNGNAF